MTEDIDTNADTIVPGGYWHWLDNGRIQCDLCPRHCTLSDGQRGLCYVRARVGDSLYLTTYGRSSGFCIDPIEKKPLNHFYPGTPVLSFGTAGCNLACRFCQNWDMSKARHMDVLMDRAMPEQLAAAAKALQCSSVAFTYNDPVIFQEYAIDVAKACHEQGINTVAVTAGYHCPTPRAEFYRHIDAANIDLKAFSEKFYWKITGSHLQEVLDTLLYLKHETSVWFEITNLIIPGENDSSKELDAMSQFIVEQLGADTPIHFTAFHPDYKMLQHAATPLATLKRAREIAISHGIHYVYTGNVHDELGSSTYCHQCKKCIVGRDWYRITYWGLSDNGCCIHCDTPCHGQFQGMPVQWGPRRLPVRLSQHINQND